ncbi:hypothetical protein ATANTOWER_015828, partial [Ataeniobius toweri]|nr:hypothetical protein [Ataeniobius toweri]
CCFVTFYTRKAALEAQNALHNIKTLTGKSLTSVLNQTRLKRRPCGRRTPTAPAFGANVNTCFGDFDCVHTAGLSAY